MKKITRVFALLAAGALALSGCSSNNSSDGDETKIVVGASPVPHKGILEYIQKNLAKEAGITIEIKEYQDYVQPNVALSNKEIDANFFQHIPYFDEEVKTKNYTFEHGEGVHLEPYGIYTQKGYADLNALPEGATVGITNDPSNQGRALALLEDAGILTVKKDVESPTIHDLESNPKNLKFTEAEAPAVPQILPDVDIAIINGNYALQNNLVPSKDAIYTEKTTNNPYVNILAWNKEADAKKIEAVKKLEELLHSDKVKKYIEETYPNGEVIPAS
ncbi:MAG: MetQ/NlpA family ABC transporter substrate-binding protein [Actinomycetaceae bacterium]|nr:MetQ/NlpA family ABC transporter substrate-binding protein [Actinomycetaceae bacterium]